MMIQSFARKAIMILTVASFFAACANPRPLTYPAGVEPRNSDQAQSIQSEPDLVTHLPTAGDVLIAGGVGGLHTTLKTAEFYDPTTLKFSSTGKMASTRAGFGAVSFASGPLNHQVLVAGGASGRAIIGGHSLRLHATALGTAELYDPATGKFTATGNMVAGRGFFSTTQLNDGTVLITGGLDSLGTPLISAEIFDPSTGMFTATTGPMNTGRAFHTATLLNDHTVLIAGGVTGVTLDTTDTTEIYDPTLKTFTANVAAPMVLGTAGHTATLISGCSCALDGKVAVTGGLSASGGIAFSNFQVQIYDPVAPSFSAAPTSLTDDRVFHTATLLANGKLVIAGGLKGFVKVSIHGITAFAGGGARNSAEIFDPTSSTLTCVNGVGSLNCNRSMVNARAGNSATLFTSGPLAGEILLAGGVGGVKSGRGTPHPLATAELYNPATGLTGAFTATGKMHAARVMQQAALLQ